MPSVFMGKTYYKGNLHLHTTASDGRRTVEEAAALYARKGYDFFAVTDHWKTAPEARFNGLLALPGCEYDFGRDVREGIFHILSLCHDHAPQITREDSPETCIRAIHEAGGLAVLAHPAWSMNTTAHLERAKQADFTEIYNTVSGLPYNCRPDSGALLDLWAASGNALPLLASDDTHFYEDDACKSFVMVAADAPDRPSIRDALHRGDFFATQGPMLSAAFDGTTLRVQTDDAAMMIYYTDAVWNPHRTQRGEHLTEGTFTLSDRETFVRVEVCDAAGKRAWSRYYFKDESV